MKCTPNFFKAVRKKRNTHRVGKKLNSNLQIRPAVVKFCFPWGSLSLIFLTFSWQMTACAFGQVKNKKQPAQHESLLVADDQAALFWIPVSDK